MRLTSIPLLACLAAGACHRSAPARPAAAHSSPPASRGFDPSLAARPAPPTAAELDKVRRLAGPAHFAGRPKPSDHGLDVYLDGAKESTVPASKVGDRIALASVLPKQKVRAALAHGDSGEVWIEGGELADYDVRLNRRGQLKLEWRQSARQGGGGSGGGSGSGGGVGRGGGGGRAGRGGGDPGEPAPGSARREREVRDLEWIEVRTAGSPRLPDEPHP